MGHRGKYTAGIGNPFTMTGQPAAKGHVVLSHADWIAFDAAMDDARHRFSEGGTDLDWYTDCVKPALESAGFRLSRINGT